MVEQQSATSTARVLVVDDNEMNRDLLSRRLLRQGHETALAENGLVAIEQLQQSQFDLILLDIMMPIMNGYEVLERVKADAAWRDIPVIVISAADDMESIVRCIELGAEDYLPKPYNTLLLKARINASLEKKALRVAETAFMRETAVLQGIGQELNATLDTPRAMEITLGWVLRQTGDQAGFMGLYQDGRVHVIASQGYTYEMTRDNGILLIDELPAALEAITHNKAAFVADTRGAGILWRTQSQLAVPVCRDNQVVALIVAENDAPKQWRASTLAFLDRLSDLAAMAIANGQMMADVQSANKANAELVSLVTGEMAPAMNAISEYAGLLLAGGDADEVKKTHGDYLRAIQANLDRITQLIADFGFGS